MSDASGQPRSAASPTCTSARAPATPRTPCAGSRASEPCDVVDLGAGTGKLTRSLVDARSPGDGRRAASRDARPAPRRRCPRRRPSKVERRRSRCAAESADVVTVAQAFHWFDHGPALVEIARVLRPGGRIALVWNVRDESEPYVSELSDAMVGRTGVDDGVGRADRRERPVRAGRACHLQPRPGGRPGDAAGARALPQLLRRSLRGGAGAGAAERRRPVHGARP